MRFFVKSQNDLVFTKLLGSIIIANFLSTVLLNLFELPVKCTGFVYAFSFIGSWLLVQAMVFRKNSVKYLQDKISFLFLVVLIITLASCRLTYLLDWIPENTVLVVGDDFARLAELISMTLSEKYPLSHPGNQEYLLSFYYTSLYPMAVLKLLIPVLSLKNVIALGNTLYHSLILVSLLEVSQVMLRKHMSVKILIFCCTLFGGLDWMMMGSLSSVSGDFEWWQMGFNGNTQISSFFSGMYWVIHHFVGFYAVILAYAFLFYTKKTKKYYKETVVSLILASAFYSSPFSVMSVPLFLFIHWKLVWRRFIRTRVFPVMIFLMTIPLFIFLNKSGSQKFVISKFHLEFTGHFWMDKILSLPVYLTLVPMIEFGGILFVLFFFWKKFTQIEKKYFTASLIFFISTYFIAFSGWNNYSMRGMFLPTFVFFFLFSRYFGSLLCLKSELRSRKILHSKTFVVCMLIFFSIGTMKEWVDKVQVSLKNSRLAYRMLDKIPPKQLSKQMYYDFHNESLKTIKFQKTMQYTPEIKYNYERFVSGMELNDMVDWEIELLRYPRVNFFY